MRRVIAAVPLLLLFWMEIASAAERSATLTAIVAPVSQGLIENDIVVTGNVAAWREALIGSEAGGLAVIEVLVDEGDEVKKGAPLARLSNKALLAQVSQQKAVIAELDASLTTAESDLRRARSVSSGVISGQATEQRETLVRTTSAKLEAAKAALDEIQARLSQTEIVAPTAGLISSRSAVVGQVVQTGSELFRLVQDGRIEVDALVPEAGLLNVKPGQGVRVIGPQGATERATVRSVAPVVDVKTRLGTVRIALGSETRLMPGMFARVEIATEAISTLVVPLKALVWRQSKAGVFKVEKGTKVIFTEVATGRKTSDSVEIKSGLQVGDDVVVEGAGLLNDGDSVKVKMATFQENAAP